MRPIDIYQLINMSSGGMVIMNLEDGTAYFGQAWNPMEMTSSMF